MLNKEKILKEIAVAIEEQPEMDSQIEGVEGIDNAQTQDVSDVEQTQETLKTSVDENFVIDGEIFSPDQIKEWKQGYLRQSDYTKKTQELSLERQRVKDAVELYDYLQSNPELAKQLATQDNVVGKQAPTPENKAYQELSYRLATMELDAQLNSIKSKDSNIDEVELLNIATQNNCTLDVAYNIYRGKNFDKILEQKLKENSSKLTEEITKNGSLTQTLISNGDKPNSNGNFGLSNDEVMMANKLGMSLEEYSKWK